MNETEVMKCPKCGKSISDRAAKYCPYCAEPLGKLRLRRNRAVLRWGVALTLIGAITVALVQPRIDYSRVVSAGALLEVWISGILSLLVGIGFIVYGYHLKRHQEHPLEQKEGVKP